MVLHGVGCVATTLQLQLGCPSQNVRTVALRLLLINCALEHRIS